MKATAANMTTMRGTRTPGRKRHRSRDYTSRHRPDDLGFVAGGRGGRNPQIAKSHIAFGNQITWEWDSGFRGKCLFGGFVSFLFGLGALCIWFWVGFVSLGWVVFCWVDGDGRLHVFGGGFTGWDSFWNVSSQPRTYSRKGVLLLLLFYLRILIEHEDR